MIANGARRRGTATLSGTGSRGRPRRRSGPTSSRRFRSTTRASDSCFARDATPRTSASGCGAFPASTLVDADRRPEQVVDDDRRPGTRSVTRTSSSSRMMRRARRRRRLVLAEGTDGVLEMLEATRNRARHRNLESRRVARRALRERHTYRGCVARGAVGRDGDHRRRGRPRGAHAIRGRRDRAGPRRRRRWRARGARRYHVRSRLGRQPACRRASAIRRRSAPSALSSRRIRGFRIARTCRSRVSTRPGEVTARVWERGVGETLSSGTSAVAVAAATHGEGDVVVHFPGGDLRVRLEHGRATLYGTAERVGESALGKLDEAAVGIAEIRRSSPRVRRVARRER